jgi:hypothetical protein
MPRLRQCIQTDGTCSCSRVPSHLRAPATLLASHTACARRCACGAGRPCRVTCARYPWHPKMAIFEHEHFFFQLFLADQKVAVCPHVSVFHYRAPKSRRRAAPEPAQPPRRRSMHRSLGPRTSSARLCPRSRGVYVSGAHSMLELNYAADSLRFKEHLFARHFCDAFPRVRSFVAPFWKYDCVRFELCPQWAPLPCVPMEDAWQLVRDRQREMALMARALATSSSAPPSSQAGSEVSESDAKTAKELLSYSPRQVLILGEGGSGAAMLSRLFARSNHYLLWREPHNWRFSAHMPDELLGAMIAGLFRCEVRAAHAAPGTRTVCSSDRRVCTPRHARAAHSSHRNSSRCCIRSRPTSTFNPKPTLPPTRKRQLRISSLAATHSRGSTPRSHASAGLAWPLPRSSPASTAACLSLSSSFQRPPRWSSSSAIPSTCVHIHGRGCGVPHAPHQHAPAAYR